MEAFDLGDNLIVGAVLPALKKKYDRVEVITQRPQHVVYENNPHIDKLAVHDPGDIPGGGAQYHAWFSIRAKEYAFLVNLSHSVEAKHAFLMDQTWFWWPVEYRRKMSAGSYVETVADICGVPYGDCWPQFFPTDQEHAEAQRTKKRFCGTRPVIGWVISGSRHDKVYPYSSLVIGRLIRELDMSVMLFGAPGGDRDKAQIIEENVKQTNGGLQDFHIAMSHTEDSNEWPIRRSLTQLQHCDLVIGPDTGAMWGVAACEMPKIMLLSHASAENITGRGWRNTITLHADPVRVPCWNCARLHDMTDTCTLNHWGNAAACISDISADCLVTAAKAALSDAVARERLMAIWSTNVAPGYPWQLPATSTPGNGLDPHPLPLPAGLIITENQQEMSPS